MGETYSVRAKLEFEWDFNQKGSIKSPQNLPIKFGPFQLDQSPNFEFYLVELGWVDPDSKGASQPDWNYPVSHLYIDTEIDSQTDQHPTNTADDTLEQLEAMFRLFQKGDIYLRRHKYMWHLKNGIPELVVWLNFPPPIKAEPTTSYNRGPYILDDRTLENFIEFFNSHWDVVHQKPKPLYNALYRFSSSYDRRTLADRLIELIIALEALFGDKEKSDNLTYKISLRCAALLYPAGEAREKAFKTIKKIYGERSAILHGGKLDTKYTNEDVHQLEDHVRRSIIKFLEQFQKGNPINSGDELDSLLFFRKEENSY